MADSSYWLLFVVVMGLIFLVGVLGSRGAAKSRRVVGSDSNQTKSIAEETLKTFADEQAAINDPSLIDADLTPEEKLALLEDKRE